MANYRIQRARGREGSTIYAYEAAGHYECVPTRLFDKEGGGANDVEGAKVIMGITYFVPGGSTEFTSNPMESIYYILTGEMTLKTEDCETVLKAGDSFHCVGGCKKSVRNTGTEVTQMLVVLLPPQA
ncbi:MAG: cupin domain-containing protein [Oscillospiraceae bacterium]|nr:cupin domain-containing protein [Oscillospiraceae bacterium]